MKNEQKDDYSAQMNKFIDDLISSKERADVSLEIKSKIKKTNKCKDWSEFFRFGKSTVKNRWPPIKYYS